MRDGGVTLRAAAGIGARVLSTHRALRSFTKKRETMAHGILPVLVSGVHAIRLGVSWKLRAFRSSLKPSLVSRSAAPWLTR